MHRWFHFKEGFAANLLSAIGIDTGELLNEGAIFLDPFCGYGTTLTAGDIEHQWRARRIGVEINPFLAFVAKTKTAWRKHHPVRLGKLGSEVLTTPLREDIRSTAWPTLSSFHNKAMFLPERVSALLDAVNRIKQIPDPERDLLLLGVAAVAERVSFYRQDGRALRILRSPGELKERTRLTVEKALRQVWSVFEEDLRTLQERGKLLFGKCTVVHGDGRALRFPENFHVYPGQVTLMVYSPPYLNHIDYTEVYKIELWLLQFVKTQQEMLAIRKQTLRSHASIGIMAANPTLPTNVMRALEVASSAVTSTGKKWHRKFGALTRAYLTDLHQTLERQYELLQPGGRTVCVISNSAHGSSQHRVPIAADLFIAAIADSLVRD